MSDDEKAENSSNNSPKNVNCLSPERQIKRPRTEASSPIEINTKSDESTDRPLPGFVAGASPAKFITADQLKEINNELGKMALAHEIAFDPNFSVEQLKERNTDELTKKVEEIATKAFYDSISSKLKEEPPNYEPIFNLYAELKPLAIETVTPQASKIFNQVDPDEPRRQFKSNCLDMRGLLLEFLNLLAQLCAPVRDEEVKKLREETDIVEMFRGIHQLLKNMKHDMINFTVKQTRHQFLEHSAKFECEKFMKVLELYPNGADETEAWLDEALDEYLKTKNDSIKEINQTELSFILSIAYARLLEGKRDDITFPETLKYDMGRVNKLVDERLQLSLALSGVFIASNLAGKDVCEKTDFKQRLKSNLIAILQDATKQNYESHLENLYLECNKQLEEALKSAWTGNYSSLLKSQIEALKNVDNSIKKVVDERIFTVICTVLRGPQAMSKEGTKLPPGLGLIESEIVALISRYLSITIHNSQSFGALYLERLNRRLSLRNAGQGTSSAN